MPKMTNAPRSWSTDGAKKAKVPDKSPEQVMMEHPLSDAGAKACGEGAFGALRSIIINENPMMTNVEAQTITEVYKRFYESGDVCGMCYTGGAAGAVTQKILEILTTLDSNVKVCTECFSVLEIMARQSFTDEPCIDPNCPERARHSDVVKCTVRTFVTVPESEIAAEISRYILFDVFDQPRNAAFNNLLKDKKARLYYDIVQEIAVRNNTIIENADLVLLGAEKGWNKIVEEDVIATIPINELNMSGTNPLLPLTIPQSDLLNSGNTAALRKSLKASARANEIPFRHVEEAMGKITKSLRLGMVEADLVKGGIIREAPPATASGMLFATWNGGSIDLDNP